MSNMSAVGPPLHRPPLLKPRWDGEAESRSQSGNLAAEKTTTTRRSFTVARESLFPCLGILLLLVRVRIGSIQRGPESKLLPKNRIKSHYSLPYKLHLFVNQASAEILSVGIKYSYVTNFVTSITMAGLCVAYGK